MPRRFLLDEDVHPATAAAARALGLDAVSVHEIGRTGPGFGDEDHLRYAGAEGRVMVTRNRDDFLLLTREFFRAGEPHGGLLIVPYSLPNSQPGAIARALAAWAERTPSEASTRYVVDFVSGP